MEKSKNKIHFSVILPTYNEAKNILPIIKKFLSFKGIYDLELIVVDDNSKDGTSDLVRKLSEKNREVLLINRLGRSGLSSAIKEGCLNARGKYIAVMDTDGQHEVKTIIKSLEKLISENKDMIIGSRFQKGAKIKGLSDKRKEGSSLANIFARYSLSKNYRHLTDFMSGCIVMRRESCIEFIKKIDVSGFKFTYELLSLSKGFLKISELSLIFKPRIYGYSKLDLAIVWDFLVSLIHTFLRRVIPRKAISFGFVGATGVIVQFAVAYSLMFIFKLTFYSALPFAVVSAATSNYLINNILTFRNNRLRKKALIVGLIKFLFVSTLPIIANVGLATSFYNNISTNTFFSQLAGIVVVFIWNYVASSRLVWNNQ